MSRRYTSRRGPSPRPYFLTSSCARRLRVEALEDRRVLAAVTVSNLLDLVNGDTSSIANLIADDGGDGVSLREAVVAANSTAGTDDIDFSITGTITLGGTELLVTDAMTITGPGADQLTLDAGHGVDNVPNTGDGFRIFNIDGIASPPLNVAIHGLTLTGGDLLGLGGDPGKGGAILNRERLTVSESEITGNGATFGGGVYNYYGNLEVSNSTLAGNHALADGGAVLNRAGLLTVIGSTLSGNVAGQSGGGITNSTYGAATVTGSTISNNSADLGGGIHHTSNQDSLLTVTGSTLSGNTATQGGGIYAPNGNTATLSHTIVANSLSGGDTYTSGSFNGEFNVIEDGSGGIADTIAGDPLLAALADNGGLTETHRLLPGSPAIDAGDPAAVAGSGGVPLFDQRGAGFDRVRSIGIGTIIDIGSFEVQDPFALPMPLPPLIVDSIADEVDFDLSPGQFSLREAIFLANFQAGADTITFDPTLFSTQQTIGLTLGQLTVTDDLTVIGPGFFLLTIDGGNGGDNLPDTGDGFRVFRVDDGDDSVDRPVHFSGLTITGGDVSGDGGGIFNREDLSLDLTTITNNSATGSGGGVFGGDGSDAITLTNSTLSGNMAGDRGGGIFSGGFSTATITRSTLYDNQAATGGGIYNRAFGTLNLDHGTISGNMATGSTTEQGGAIFNNGDAIISSSTILFNRGSDPDGAGGIQNGQLVLPSGISTTIHNSIVSGNGTNGEVNLVGNGFGGDYNVLGTSPVIRYLGPNDRFYSTDSPLFSPLDFHGGPTKTHVPLISSRSLGIDAGVSTDSFDQRGASFQRDDGNGVDRGAVELQSLPLVVDTVEDTYDFDLSPGDLSLREAMLLARSTRQGEVITFDPTLFAVPQTIHLNEQLPWVYTDITINGPGADLLTIDAGHGADQIPATQDGFRIFEFRDFDVFRNQQVTLFGMTLTGGDIAGNGGAIFAAVDRLTLRQSTITGNAASDQGTGGGIHLAYSSSNYRDSQPELVLSYSTLSGNSAGDGGAIFATSSSSSLSITRSTISGNATALNGGGISTSGDVSLISSTVSGNQSGLGGGIFVSNGSNATVIVEIRNSIVAGNTDSSGASDLRPAPGQALTVEFSLIGDNTGSGLSESQTPDANGNLIGSAAGSGPVDPLLGPLQDNGGPTLTHALLAGSPAIDAGNPSVAFSASEFDQRGAGFFRAGDGGVAGLRIDIGAYEVQTAAPALPGDYNLDGIVDAVDYTVWRDTLGQSVPAFSGADGNGDAQITEADYQVWRSNFGATLPSPPVVSLTARAFADDGSAQDASAGQLNDNADPASSRVASAQTDAGPLLDDRIQNLASRQESVRPAASLVVLAAPVQESLVGSRTSEPSDASVFTASTPGGVAGRDAVFAVLSPLDADVEDSVATAADGAEPDAAVNDEEQLLLVTASRAAANAGSEASRYETQDEAFADEEEARQERRNGSRRAPGLRARWGLRAGDA